MPQNAAPDDDGAEVFADGFFLGRVDLGDLLGLRCVRSPDGDRLVYFKKSRHPEGALGLESVRLSDLEQVSRLLPGVHPLDFSFRPDGSTLAVLGIELHSPMQSSPTPKLYLLDAQNWEVLATHDVSFVDILGWNPDGDHLAGINWSSQPGQPYEAWAVHVGTGEVIAGILDLDQEYFFRSTFLFPSLGWQGPLGLTATSLGLDMCVEP